MYGESGDNIFDRDPPYVKRISMVGSYSVGMYFNGRTIINKKLSLLLMNVPKHVRLNEISH